MKKRMTAILAGTVCLVIGSMGGYWLRDAGITKTDASEMEVEERTPWAYKTQPAAKSRLKNSEECYLCGSSAQSLMDLFHGYEDLGVIFVNDWYVLDMRIRNHDDDGTLTGAQEHINITSGGLGKGKHSYYCSPNSDRGISELTIYNGENDVFDVKKVQKHLCQTCLDKVLEVMEVYGPEDETAKPRDLCLVDFQTLELYSLQGDYISYYVRDYYVQVDDSREEEIKISAIYAPVLENGHKAEE